jgi:hypothetical protein
MKTKHLWTSMDSHLKDSLLVTPFALKERVENAYPLPALNFSQLPQTLISFLASSVV